MSEKKSGTFHMASQEKIWVLLVEKRGLIMYLAALKKVAIRHAHPYYAIYCKLTSPAPLPPLQPPARVHVDAGVRYGAAGTSTRSLMILYNMTSRSLVLLDSSVSHRRPLSTLLVLWYLLVQYLLRTISSLYFDRTVWGFQTEAQYSRVGRTRVA